VASIAPLLCPLMMVAMIPMIVKGRKEKQTGSEENRLTTDTDHSSGSDSCH
jgi:hypothetical protein